MKRDNLKKLVDLYPDDFRDKYGDQILDYYDQSNEDLNKSDLFTSIFLTNLKKYSGPISFLVILPPLFFVCSNLFYYSILKTTPLDFISQINKMLESPAYLLGSIFIAGILATYSSLNFEFQINQNSISIKQIGMNKNKAGLSALLFTSVVFAIIFIYLFAENIGF